MANEPFVAPFNHVDALLRTGPIMVNGESLARRMAAYGRRYLFVRNNGRP